MEFYFPTEFGEQLAFFAAVVSSLIGLVVFKQRLDAAALAGIGLICAGVLVINLFSRSSAH